jgi:hypothetical protein
MISDTLLLLFLFCFVLDGGDERAEKNTVVFCVFLAARECRAIGLRVLRASIE